MNTSNRVGKWSVIIGIVIVLNLFFNYALSLVYKAPDFVAFCPNSQVMTIPQTQNECVSQGGQWTNDAAYGKQAPMPVGQTAVGGYCNLQYTCSQNFQAANDSYSRNIFIILVVLGAISVFLGNIFATNAVIGNGLSLAGVFSFVIASMRYWTSADNLVKVLILAIALALLFWVAIKKFKNNG